MGLTSLIFSRDERVVRILGLLLTELDINVEHVSDLVKAQERLWCQKYDGVFSEVDDEQGADLLRLVRKSKHNRRSIAFALSGATVRMTSAFELGAHFVLQKPLSLEKVKRTLKAAHGLMMREQRSHYRHPTATKVNLKTPTGRTVTATLKDLSQSGAMIDADVILRKTQALHLRFVLPETDIGDRNRWTSYMVGSDGQGRRAVRESGCAVARTAVAMGDRKIGGRRSTGEREIRHKDSGSQRYESRRPGRDVCEQGRGS